MFNFADGDVETIQSLLIGKVKKTQDPILLMTLLVLITMTKDEMKRLSREILKEEYDNAQEKKTR